MRERKMPDGSFLQILGDPPAEPVLCIYRSGTAARSILWSSDREWLRVQLAAFDPPPDPPAGILKELGNENVLAMLAQPFARLSPPLRWTPERPTVEGFYFARFANCRDTPFVIQARRDGVTPGHEMSLWQVPFLLVDLGLREGAEFAGPISLPEE